MTMKLTGEQRRELSTLLLACPSMQDKSLRNDVLSLLSDTVRDAIPRRDQNRADVISIVRICNDHPGALEDLIEAVRCFDAGSDPMQALDHTIAQLLPQPIPRADVDDLRQILSSVMLADAELRNRYHHIAPPGQSDWWTYPQGHNNQDTLSHILRQLAKARIQKPDNTHPLLAFVMHLAAAHEPSVQAVRDDLHAWSRRVASSLGIQPEPSAISAEPEEQAYLLVQIRPKQPLTETTTLSTARFYVDAWLVRRATEHTPENLGQDAEYLLTEVPSIFQELVRTSQRRLFATDCELAIEVFLPLELLLHEVDHWQIKLGLRSMDRVGSKYRVVVRSLERVTPAYMQDLWNDWWARWKRFEQQHQQLREEIIVRVCSHDECHALSTRLLHEHIVGYIQTFIAAADDTTLEDILVSIIDQGIPVAVCPRPQSNMSQQRKTSLEQILATCFSGNLPTIIREVRRQAVAMGDDTHAGHDLTLLWDDPNRLPPPARALFPGMK